MSHTQLRFELIADPHIAKMQGSNGDTAFTFDDNVVTAAEGGTNSQVLARAERDRDCRNGLSPEDGEHQLTPQDHPEEDLEVNLVVKIRGHIEDQVPGPGLREQFRTDLKGPGEMDLGKEEDEGSVMRIQELERRGRIMESGATRIYEKGMEIRDEYSDQVQHLRGLLSNTEDRLRQMEMNSEYANNVAEKLYVDGKETQSNLENSIIALRDRSESV